jgi:hypothetical protein
LYPREHARHFSMATRRCAVDLPPLWRLSRSSPFPSKAMRSHPITRTHNCATGFNHCSSRVLVRPAVQSQIAVRWIIALPQTATRSSLTPTGFGSPKRQSCTAWQTRPTAASYADFRSAGQSGALFRTARVDQCALTLAPEAEYEGPRLGGPAPGIIADAAIIANDRVSPLTTHSVVDGHPHQTGTAQAESRALATAEAGRGAEFGATQEAASVNSRVADVIAPKT